MLEAKFTPVMCISLSMGNNNGVARIFVWKGILGRKTGFCVKGHQM